MNDGQLSRLWAFSRGDTLGVDFEEWFLAQEGLEVELGSELHWALLAGDYRKKDEVWVLRKALTEALQPRKQCECPSLRDLAAVPMGGEGMDERVFATVKNVVDHGGHQWWLHLSKCKICGQHWMIAQEERIFDEYFLRRLSSEAASKITASRIWPTEFLTYEAVLKVGRELSQPCIFLEAFAPSLIWTAEDLRNERPDITAEEIAYLLGITPGQAARLLTV